MLTSTRRAGTRLGSALVLIPFALPRHCHAASLVFRVCRPTDKPLLCRLDSILTFLYVSAALLGLLLIVAVLAAVRTYKRKARKLTPDEITSDAQ